MLFVLALFFVVLGVVVGSLAVFCVFSCWCFYKSHAGDVAAHAALLHVPPRARDVLPLQAQACRCVSVSGVVVVVLLLIFLS